MIWQPLLTKSVSVFAAATCNPNTDNPGGGFFGIPHWWEYISTGQTDALGKCIPQVQFPGGIWAIGLAIVDMLLVVAGLVAVVSIIVAGVQYMMTIGNAEKGVSARKRIVNSLIGLAIVLVATGLVTFIGNNIK